MLTACWQNFAPLKKRIELRNARGQKGGMPITMRSDAVWAAPGNSRWRELASQEQMDGRGQLRVMCARTKSAA